MFMKKYIYMCALSSQYNKAKYGCNCIKYKFVNGSQTLFDPLTLVAVTSFSFLDSWFSVSGVFKMKG